MVCAHRGVVQIPCWDFHFPIRFISYWYKINNKIWFLFLSSLCRSINILYICGTIIDLIVMFIVIRRPNNIRKLTFPFQVSLATIFCLSSKTSFKINLLTSIFKGTSIFNQNYLEYMDYLFLCNFVYWNYSVVPSIFFVSLNPWTYS